jgi:hypothetical protein
METYTVKLWVTNANNYRVQRVVEIDLPEANKDQHDKAEKQAMSLFKGMRPEVVSVKYQ